MLLSWLVHLGNVLATLTDKKLQKGKPAPLEGEVAYIEADVVTATDYYPFVPILRDGYAGKKGSE